MTVQRVIERTSTRVHADTSAMSSANGARVAPLGSNALLQAVPAFPELLRQTREAEPSVPMREGQEKLPEGDERGPHGSHLGHQFSRLSMERPQAPLTESRPDDSAEAEAEPMTDTEKRFGHDFSQVRVHTAARSRLMRDEAEPPATDPAMGLTLNHKFAWEKTFMDPPRSAGPFKYKDKLKFEVNAKMMSVPATGQSQTKAAGVVIGGPQDQHTPTPPTRVEAGPKSGDGAWGAAAEIKHECQEKIYGFHPEFKGGAEWTNKGGKISVGFSLNHKFGEGQWKIAAKPIDVSLIKWKAGEVPDILVVSPGIELTVPAFEHVTESGLRFIIELKFGGAVDITPDYATIGQWLLETLGAETLVALGGAVVIAGSAVVLVAASYYTIQEGRDIGELTAGAVKSLQSYSQSYANVMMGGSPTEGMGAAEGAARAKADLAALTVNFPDAVVTQKAREMGIYSKMVSIAKPAFRQKAEEEFKKRHPWRVAIFGVPPSFYDHLDTRLGHVGNESEEQWVGTRDAKGGI